jgi:hypothetical protein
VQIVRELNLPASTAWTFGHVDDLGRYPSWMRMVHEAVPTSAGPDDPPDAPAWIVELQAQVGPFARSKRLRMVRARHVTDRVARFDRIEVDGRAHATWTLEATVAALEPGSDDIGFNDAGSDDTGRDSTRLTMTLTYGGRLWT